MEKDVDIQLDLVKIGNSQGIRIPRWLVEKYGFAGKVNLHLGKNDVVISPTNKVRKNWAAAFKKMAEKNDDILLEEDPLNNDWDEEEWQW